MTLEADRGRLLELLRTHAYREGRVTLASGRESDFYVDCRGVVLSAEGLVLVGRLLLREALALDVKLQAVGGLTLGADPIASAVALTSQLVGLPVGAFLVRKEPKGHGTGQWCEGLQLLPPGARAVIVEDVVTSGGSALKAADRARAEGLVVTGVVALVDREEGGREALEAAGLAVRSLFSRKDFVA